MNINALEHASIHCGSIQAHGFSRAGLATYFYIPAYDVCFDMGECPLAAVPIKHVFITHAHGDHLRCWLRHFELRNMLGHAKASHYFMPDPIIDRVKQLVEIEHSLTKRLHAPAFKNPAPKLHGCSPGPELYSLPHSQKLKYSAFEVSHTLYSLGYTLWRERAHLKPSYRGLPSAEIGRLVRDGHDVKETEFKPLVSFIGDCRQQSLFDCFHIWQSEMVVIEATFLDPKDEALAEDSGHTHIQSIRDLLLQRGPEIDTKYIVLKHFSLKHSPDEIKETVQRCIPKDYQSRIRLLL